MAAVALRDALRHEWLLALAGLLSIIFGVMLMVTPGAGALVITWLIGWWALVYGVSLLMLAWQLHNLEDRGRRRHGAPRHAAAST